MINEGRHFLYPKQHLSGLEIDAAIAVFGARTGVGVKEISTCFRV